MLIEFSIGNFWSFKEMQTLQMQAAKIVSKFPKVDENNVHLINDQISLLRTKAIYGANASGKSNLIRAMVSMLRIVRESLKDPEILSKRITPFLLETENANTPSFFQIVFTLDDIIYRYGFEATRREIISEWLFGKPLKSKDVVRERYYFTREGTEVNINGSIYPEGKPFAVSSSNKPPLYRENALFLPVVAAWNGQLAIKIMDYLQNGFSILSGLDDEMPIDLALTSMSNQGFKEKVTELLQAIDPTIRRIEREEFDLDALATMSDEDKILADLIKKQGKRLASISVLRSQIGKKENEIAFTLIGQEAEGTKKMFSLSPILFKSLEHGNVLVIDEFDARMHPRLTRKIVELFQSAVTNPKNAQLIFVTHDTNLMHPKILRRDQIAFARKDKDGVTELYTLVNFKGVRNDASYEKDYLLGKYGALPNNLNALEGAVIAITHGENS